MRDPLALPRPSSKLLTSCILDPVYLVCKSLDDNMIATAKESTYRSEILSNVCQKSHSYKARLDILRSV